MAAGMSPYVDDPDVKVYLGHVLEVLAQLPEKSVQLVITSPPYYGLRSYGTPPQVWGGDGSCGEDGHEWQTSRAVYGNNKPSAKSTLQDHGDDGRSPYLDAMIGTEVEQGFCRRCHAWRGELGQEPTLSAYLDHLLAVFDAVRKVLRDDGCLFVNIGDSYAGSWGNQGRKATRGTQRPINGPIIQPLNGQYPDLGSNTGRITDPGLKPKDLMLVPFRFAIAMQERGWYVRSDITWCKSSAMPESVQGSHYSRHRVPIQETDPTLLVDCPGCPKCLPHGGYILRIGAGRPTSATEHIFLFAKSADYHYDHLAVRQGDANLRNWWLLGPDPLNESHYAAYPAELARRCIALGTSEHGCCAECGSPWVREITTEYENPGNRTTNGPRSMANRAFTAGFPVRLEKRTETTGWRPTCTHDAPVQPCTVLDPFLGSGRTAVVARALGRRCIGIELSPEYMKMIRRQTAQQSIFAQAAD